MHPCEGWIGEIDAVSVHNSRVIRSDHVTFCWSNRALCCCVSIRYSLGPREEFEYLGLLLGLSNEPQRFIALSC